MKIITVKQRNIQKIKNIFRKEKHPLFKRRLQAVILAMDGKMKRKDIADKTGVHRNRITKWIILFNQKGVNGLMSKPRIGRNSIMAEKDKKRLKKLLRENPETAGIPYRRWSAKAIHFWIKKNCGWDCSMSEAYKMLKKMKIE
jgi:transposase